MLNEKIRALRKKAGYSQEQMARKLHLTLKVVRSNRIGRTIENPGTFKVSGGFSFLLRCAK